MKSSPKPELDRLTQLIELIELLRSADGCPWDRAQGWSDVRPYLLEEAHEVADALDREDWQGLQEELGDLLFQLCFLGQLASEAGLFDMADVIDGIHRKMVERHPHVFSPSAADDHAAQPTRTPEEVAGAWEKRKLRATSGSASILEGLPRALPALVGAFRLGQKASAVGFDWPSSSGPLDKADEELAELRAAVLEADEDASDENAHRRVVEELGDLLFALASAARHLGIDPERALALANLKFRRRFAAIESGLGQELGEPTTPALRKRMEQLWNQAKLAEKD